MESGENGYGRKIVIILLATMLANLFFLDIKEIVKDEPIDLPDMQAVVAPTAPITPSISDNLCPVSCLDKINEATASVRLKEPVVTIVQQAKNTSEVKEFFIPIGAGVNSSEDWEDVPGLLVTVDGNQYGKIKSVVFEATVRVPTLDQWVKVRLYNVTNKSPVWSSEVHFTIGSQPTLLVSQPFALDGGVKSYQVQMKTQIKRPSYLDQSRIHMIIY